MTWRLTPRPDPAELLDLGEYPPEDATDAIRDWFEETRRDKPHDPDDIPGWDDWQDDDE